MNGEGQEQDQEVGHWFEIDYVAGIALCVLAGMTFAAAVSGWLFIFAELTELRSRLDQMQTERRSQISDVGNAMRVLEMRIEAVSSRLQQLQRVAHRVGDRTGPADRSTCSLGKSLDAQCMPAEDAARSPKQETR